MDAALLLERAGVDNGAVVDGTYLRNELRRRWPRTLVTALGLAAGVGLVMAIIGVSDGLGAADNAALSPLSSVGTDIIVTRTVGAVSPSPGASPGVSTGGDGSTFFGPAAVGGSAAAQQLQQLNQSDQTALLNANATVLTDLSKLGPAGTRFVHDFYVPGTLITFPQDAVATVAGVHGVTSAVPGLSLQAIHESGTVPQITDTFTTGGQTISSVQTPPALTPAERQAVFSCLQSSGAFPSGTPTTPPPGGSDNEAKFISAIQGCLPQRYQQYIAQVVVPAQTINRVLNPPATDTTARTYTAAGVDPSHTSSGLIVASQVTAGHWFDDSASHEMLVNAAYASSNHIVVGQTLTIDDTAFTVTGLVAPTLTGNISDVYFTLGTLQSLGQDGGRINEVLVKVGDAQSVDAVRAEIQRRLPGAQVVTAKQLADTVSGSLADARSLADSLSGALAVIILAAAFLVAALLTTSSVSKRVREIGALRALGWRRGRVVRQILAETVVIGVAGAVLGVFVGLGVAGVIDHFGPTLNSTTSGNAVSASSVSALFHQATTASTSRSIHLNALISWQTALIGVICALIGGVVAGVFGGWRASRLSPAAALRDLG